MCSVEGLLSQSWPLSTNPLHQGVSRRISLGAPRLPLSRMFAYFILKKKKIRILTYSMANRAPVLIFVAITILFFGRDHPAGKWSERNNLPSGAGVAEDWNDGDIEKRKHDAKNKSEDSVQITVRSVDESSVDIAVNKSLTVHDSIAIFTNPVTWLPALAYMSTLGVELMIESKITDVLFNLFHSKIPGFDQRKAGYYTCTL
jgi:NNP family nitrate/nitrite transporter-like MFS transporter